MTINNDKKELKVESSLQDTSVEIKDDVLLDQDHGYLPVLPLRNLVALPRSIVPVIVGREFSIKAIDYAVGKNNEVFVTAQKSQATENPVLKDLFLCGTRSRVLQVARMPNGTLKLLVEGICRSRVTKKAEGVGFLAVMCEDLASPHYDEKDSEYLALWRNLYDLFKKYISLNEKLSSDILNIFKERHDLDYLTDTIAVQINLGFNERQKILEIVDVKKRAFRLSGILKSEIDILKAEKSIRKRVQSQVEKNQRDYYLNEQMRAIQRELGRDDYHEEIDELRKKAEEANLPEEALEKVERELNRLEDMQPSSPEVAVSRNYVDWLISLPWHDQTEDEVSLEDAERMLNDSHASMKKAKERVIEFLAARKFAGAALKRSPIVCFVGPPGVGKTSLAKSIADALGRKMVRISLGGMRDEAEIRGHRRTYVGAMPGKIVQAMRKTGVLNPVIVLDEIDKMSTDFRGDPASALLEVLDPEQNKDFSDYFLEVSYDLSKVIFITTANIADAIPYPLLDRMEIIYLSGYTENEKFEIAQKFLLPKLLEEHALKKENVVLSDALLKTIIRDYTKEAGVRTLERILAKILRKSIQELLKNKRKKIIRITNDLLEKWLGPAPYPKPEDVKIDNVGLAHGLAWTEVGGDTLEIEVTILKGKGGLTLTGQLGEVMQESAQAAMSYIRSRAKDFGLKQGFYANLDIHIHIPEGAIPKDGPSAGITIATAIISGLTKIPVKKNVAMTGEVTLRGRVLAIGGLKEKLLAAIRFGFDTVLVPKENKKDIKEFEADLDKKLTLVFVENMDQVIDKALVKSPFVAAKKRAATKSSKTKKTTRKK